MLADDSVTAQNMGRKILADAGYEVITVNNGSAALKKIAEHKPDIIVLDVYMPGYSGLEVCQRLKEVQETSRLPVLLTVGKLEPFKPEEAKRVRAEGFIVKPFEASELLAALAKLEDKIVPRAEASKPGRFARANAALDEGRYDKSAAPEEDSGWKNRIAFPSKKKKAAEQEDGDDPAIYNAVNKDLRTTVEHKPAHISHEEQPDEARVDLGALVPEGLPKDVTPEEIAALAAAAAQVKGKIAESTPVESVPQDPSEAKTAELGIPEIRTPEIKTEEKPETKAETYPAAEPLPAEPSKQASLESPATFAEQKPVPPNETPAEQFSDIPRVAESLPDASPAEVMAAIAGLETQAAHLAGGDAGNGFGSRNTSDRRADEPVTMAVAAGAESAPASRWTAVAVALAPDEAASSLEDEMKKAHAAFAAAAPAATVPLATSEEMPATPAESAAVAEIASPVEAVVPELLGSVPATPEAEAPQAEPAPSGLSSMAGAATDALAAAVKEMEAVAASLFHSRPKPPAEPEPAPVPAAEPIAEAVVERSVEPVVAPIVTEIDDAPRAVEAQPVEAPVVEAKAGESPVVEAVLQPEVAASEPPTSEPASELPKQNAPEPVYGEPKEEPKEEPRSESREEPKAEEPTPVEAVAVTPEPEAVASGSVNDPSPRHVSPGHVSFHRIEPEAPAEPVAAATTDTNQKDSEIAETTAAAWASWRRIRESGDAKGSVAPQPTAAEKAEDHQAGPPEDSAAMAVAAGAEKAPDAPPAADEDGGDIANIVDSVLADMRPKIVEEISRKMKKKK